MCVCVCVCVCVSVCVCARARLRQFALKKSAKYTVSNQIQICVHINVCVCVFIRMYVCVLYKKKTSQKKKESNFGREKKYEENKLILFACFTRLQPCRRPLDWRLSLSHTHKYYIYIYR